MIQKGRPARVEGVRKWWGRVWMRLFYRGLGG
jgi:hypothetical protein